MLSQKIDTALFLVSLLLAGCADDGDSQLPDAGSPAPACSATIKLLDYKLEPKLVTVQRGEIVLCAENDGQAPHDLAVRRDANTTLGRTKTLGPGESDRFTVMLEAGDYAIFCTQAGHESLGMKGTLTVSP